MGADLEQTSIHSKPENFFIQQEAKVYIHPYRQYSLLLYTKWARIGAKLLPIQIHELAIHSVMKANISICHSSFLHKYNCAFFAKYLFDKLFRQ